MAVRQLVFPADAVTRDVFLRTLGGVDGGACCGKWRDVLASGWTGSTARYRFLVEDGAGTNLKYLDLVVMAAIAALAQDGRLRFTLADVIRRLGYPNPHASGMARTAYAIAMSLGRLSRTRIELAAVGGRGGKAWLSAVPESPIVPCVLIGDYRDASTTVAITPPDLTKPASALPLLMRAGEAKQVIGICPWQMPDFSGRRVSLIQRQMAIYITVRALDRLGQRKVLVDTMLHVVGAEFGRDDAGRRARLRALRQLVKTLDAMSKQGTVIIGYELECAGGRIRAIVLQPSGQASS